jgi:hypothetical protein
MHALYTIPVKPLKGGPRHIPPEVLDRYRAERRRKSGAVEFVPYPYHPPLTLTRLRTACNIASASDPAEYCRVTVPLWRLFGGSCAR